MWKFPLIQPLAGWLLALILVPAPLVGVETESELEATREALELLERQQLQRMREIERIEERVAEVARRNQQLRSERRELSARIAAQDREVERQQARVDQQEAELAAAQDQAAQLLRGQWLRERHRQWHPQQGEARHHGEFDARVQARREQLLAGIDRRLHELAEARDRLADARDGLIEREREAQLLQREIERQEAEQQALLARAQQEAERAELELTRLERNAQTLERVLERMRAAPPPPAPPAPSRPEAAEPADGSFAARRGSMARPVDGATLHRYGGSRGSGVHARWRGDVFEAGEDAPVQAVHRGRVVYADWMRGYGFLVILDHGDGYLTLYGNNRELLVRQGAVVERGAVIARAGATSAVIAPGLYFELRHRGETLNPASWWDSN
ncbi:peptidase M23 [Thioalkalivibrio paradoxus ARh 1]|uniref:Peptidase M23 n=1 Tax=Thioalkalivibrio paradoxus ARh 1 TaxID=713585 RepID=W0DSA7_9GAMM|nr:peptidoglycan DD-metalloendopeptidase family protein [Thioalkalivibrio paradoxus]AHE99720.1 peptidase M23 [Thioalkalivibrio paradoxus ARh 1]